MQPGYNGDAGGSVYNSPDRLAQIAKERETFIRQRVGTAQGDSGKLPGFSNPSVFNPVEYEEHLKNIAQSDIDAKRKELVTSPVDTSLSELYAGLKHLAGIVEHLEQRLAPVLTPAPKAITGDSAAQSDSNGETCPLIMEIRTASDRLGGLIQRVDAIRLRLCI